MFFIQADATFTGERLVPDVAVLVSNSDGEGKILSVGPVDPSSRFPTVRLHRRVLFPGFVNAHSHAFQRALRGHVQHASGPDSFWSWRERMYALADALDPEAIEAVSTLAFAEMLRAGFTSVGEFHYIQHQPGGTPYADPDELARRVAHAASRVGLRQRLLRVAYARAGFGVEANPRQARFIDSNASDVVSAVARLEAHGISAGLAPHSVRAVPADWMREFAAYTGVIHAHVDEQPGEIEQCLAEHGRRPLEVFADSGVVHQRFTAVHLTHPDDGELALLAASGGRVCACPTTELDLGDGFLPLERIKSPVCIGTDSHAAIDPFYEMRSLEWHARGLAGRRNVIPHEGPDGLAAGLLRIGTENGAEALGFSTGRIAAGRFADLVAIDSARLEFGASRLLPAIVFNGTPECVRDVWVGGRHVVKEGKVPGSERIVAEAERELRRCGA